MQKKVFSVKQKIKPKDGDDMDGSLSTNNENFIEKITENTDLPETQNNVEEKTQSGQIKTEKKTPKARIPFGVLAGFLVICIIVSAVSGAGGSLMLFTVMNSIYNEEQTEEQNEYVIEDSISDIAEETTEEETQQVFIPELPEYFEDGEEVTLPSLTKGDIYAKAVNSIFAIRSTYKKYYDSFFGSYYKLINSTGTGFAVSDNGYLITNYHVVKNTEQLMVTDYNGNEYTAQVIGSEPENDIAVIKINATTIPVTLGSSSALKVGDDIMVIGNPLGELSYTFTNGIVSHLSRKVKVESGETINMFQTNAAINNGNSGGPVYNMDGEVVGIASAKYASDQIEGLGFCVPVDDIKPMISDIIVFGHVTGKASLGLSLQTVTEAMASRYSIPVGCYVVDIDLSGCAYLSGIRKGDVITKIGNSEITGCDTIKAEMQSLSSGDPVTVTYYRNGETQTAGMILDEYEPADPRTAYTNVFDF